MLGPKMAQDGPKTAQDGPRRPQDGPNPASLSHRPPPQASPPGLSHRPLPQASPTGLSHRLSHRPLPQAPPTGLSHRPLPQASFTGLYHKPLPQASPASLSHRPLPQASPAGLSHRVVLLWTAWKSQPCRLLGLVLVQQSALKKLCRKNIFNSLSWTVVLACRVQAISCQLPWREQLFRCSRQSASSSANGLGTMLMCQNKNTEIMLLN